MAPGLFVGLGAVGVVIIGGLYLLFRDAAIYCERCGGVYLSGRFCETCRSIDREQQALGKLDRALEDSRLAPWRSFIDSL